MASVERKDKGLLLRFTASDLARIDVARGALSRGRWVRALVLDGLLAQEQHGPGVRGAVKAQGERDEALAAAGAPVLVVPRVEGSEAAQLRPASELVDGSPPVAGPRRVSVKPLRGKGSRSLVDPDAACTPLPAYAPRRFGGL